MVKVMWFMFQQSFGPLTMLLDFLDIYLTTSFEDRKFKNTSAMKVIFFLKIESKFRKWEKKKEKIFFVSEIIASKILLKIVSIKNRILVIGS